ncbi:hypothetical protein [Coleofasciculus sp.]|uniref:hypothetical protein n=1 Tax=Coleofasciculus sp. TaxID=3100458 RepID=UPI003A2B54B1
MARLGDGGDGGVNLTVSSGGFCRNVTINSYKKIPKPAPTDSRAIPSNALKGQNFLPFLIHQGNLSTIVRKQDKMLRTTKERP